MLAPEGELLPITPPTTSPAAYRPSDGLAGRCSAPRSGVVHHQAAHGGGVAGLLLHQVVRCPRRSPSSGSRPSGRTRRSPAGHAGVVVVHRRLEHGRVHAHDRPASSAMDSPWANTGVARRRWPPSHWATRRSFWLKPVPGQLRAPRGVVRRRPSAGRASSRAAAARPRGCRGSRPSRSPRARLRGSRRIVLMGHTTRLPSMVDLARPAETSTPLGYCLAYSSMRVAASTPSAVATVRPSPVEVVRP